MRIIAFHVDAFVTSQYFTGNPAAVCLLESWLPDSVMQLIAAEFNLSETAFVVRREDCFELRWFTPVAEVDLCGHATLASAHVLWHHLSVPEETLKFSSKSGMLEVRLKDDRIELDFPARAPKACTPAAGLLDAFNIKPQEVLKSRDYFLLYSSADEVLALKPDLAKLTGHDAVIVTAPGTDCDFVSRFFAPTIGVPEDPATGSAHCTLTPYWSAKLGKKELFARQLSPRGAELRCEDRGARVGIAGRAATFFEGVITLPDS